MVLPIFSHSEKINNNKVEKQAEPNKKGGTKSVRLEPLNVLEEQSFRKMLHGTHPHDLLEIFSRIFSLSSSKHMAAIDIVPVA